MAVRMSSAVSVATTTVPGTVQIDLQNAAPVALTQQGLRQAPTATANYALLQLGGGAIDGTSAGHAVYSANGTHIGVNALSGYTGNLLDLQVAGTSACKVDASGNQTLAGAQGLTCVKVQGGGGNVTFGDNVNIDLTPTTSGAVRVRIAGTTKAQIDAGGGIAPVGGCRITSGSGAPTTPGGANPTAGDLYVRLDTPTTANQRLYQCSVGGASPTWVGIA